MKRARLLFSLHRLSILLTALCFALSLTAQQTYFVDGFHGGVYGHYPLSWYTDFMLSQLEKHPEWCINLELEPETWDSVRSKAPEAYERFRLAMGQGRIEVVNPAYAQPYLYNISGESIIRHFQYGIRLLHEHFPQAEFLVYSSEEPCFTSALPQLLRQLGIRYVVLKNPDTCWGGYVREGGGEFVIWEGPDGSVLPCVPRYDCETLEPGSTWQTTAWKNSAAYLEACHKAGIRHPVGMCLQDAGWKDGPWLGENARRSGTQYVLWSDYFRKHLAGGEWPRRRFTQDDFCVALMWGSPVLQRIAKQVRRQENALVQAEKLASMAALSVGYRPDKAQFDEYWRTLMLSQHHDVWIVPYNTPQGMKRSQTWASMVANEWAGREVLVRRQVLESFGQRGDTFVRVYNTTAQPRSEMVSALLPTGCKRVRLEDSRGRNIDCLCEESFFRFVAQVPAYGYSTYRIIPLSGQRAEEKTAAVDANQLVMENDYYRLELDLKRGGTLNHFILKQQGGYDLIDATNPYRFGELRGYFHERGSFCSSADSAVSVREYTKNSLRQRVVLWGRVAGVPFMKEIMLWRNSPRIDVYVSFLWPRNMRIGEPYEGDWRQSRRSFYDTSYMLNVLFPTTLRQPQLTKDAPFDICESRQPSTLFNSWDSIRNNVILHWVDLVAKDGKAGLALLTDHTTSYTFAPDYPLALTLQYIGPGLWGRNYGLFPGVHGLPEGNVVHYALFPHKGNWEKGGVQQQAETWQEPLIVRSYDSLQMEDRSFLSADDPDLVLTTALAEGNALIFRLYNASSKTSHTTLHLGLKAPALIEEDLLGNPTARIPLRTERQGSRATVNLPPFGIRTYRIELNNKE